MKNCVVVPNLLMYISSWRSWFLDTNANSYGHIITAFQIPSKYKINCLRTKYIFYIKGKTKKLCCYLTCSVFFVFLSLQFFNVFPLSVFFFFFSMFSLPFPPIKKTKILCKYNWNMTLRSISTYYFSSEMRKKNRTKWVVNRRIKYFVTFLREKNISTKR